MSPVAVNVTGGTTTTPIVLTTDPHLIPVGEVTTVVVASVTGLNANGVWIVQSLSATTVRLRLSVGVGAYGGGGTMQITDTYTTIAELTNVEDAGVSATLVETTAHDGNGYATRIPTFLSGNTMRLSLNWVPAHATHNATTGLTYLLGTRLTRRFMIVWPGATKPAWFFSAWVVQDRKAAPVAGALTTSASLEVDGAPMLTAA